MFYGVFFPPLSFFLRSLPLSLSLVFLFSDAHLRLYTSCSAPLPRAPVIVLFIKEPPFDISINVSESSEEKPDLTCYSTNTLRDQLGHMNSHERRRSGTRKVMLRLDGLCCRVNDYASLRTVSMALQQSWCHESCHICLPCCHENVQRPCW